MARQAEGVLLSKLKIDRNSRMPLFLQLEDLIRYAILNGDISCIEDINTVFSLFHQEKKGTCGVI
jgi:hypothetical protein